MRILIISNLFPPDVLGGYEILCSQVTEALRSRGHSVSVLTSSCRMPCQDHDVHRELELELLFDRPFRRSRLRRRTVGRRNERRTARRIAALAPDLIFLWSQRRLTLGPARAAQASGVPVAWSLNDEYLAGFAPSSRRSSLRGLIGALSDASWARRDTLQSVQLDRVTVISRCLRDRLLAQGVPVEEAEVIYQGPPLEAFPRRDAIE